VKIKIYLFDMCCSVHLCDTSKFCSQQTHTLYFVFVRHFTSLPTCFDPCGSLSGHLIHEHLQVVIIILYYIKVTYKNKTKSVHLLATKVTSKETKI
jgi:hypothetical protein